MEERKVVIQAEHIKKYFPMKGVLGKTSEAVHAVDDVSLTVYEGELWGWWERPDVGRAPSAEPFCD